MNFRKIFLVSSLFIFIGILVAYLVDRIQISRIRKQNEKLIIEMNKSMKDLDVLDKKIDSLQNAEYYFDTITDKLEIRNK